MRRDIFTFAKQERRTASFIQNYIMYNITIILYKTENEENEE